MKQRLTIAEILPPVLLALVLAPAAMHTGSLFAQYSTPHGVTPDVKIWIGYGFALAIESCVLTFVFSGLRRWPIVFACITTGLQLIYFQPWMYPSPWLPGMMKYWRPVLAELAFSGLTGVLTYAFSELTARNMQRRAAAQQADADRQQKDAEHEQLKKEYNDLRIMYATNRNAAFEMKQEMQQLQKQLEQKENKRKAGRARWAKDREQKTSD